MLGSVALVLLCACQAVIHVGVAVNDDGSGSVTVRAHLDHAAAASAAPYVRTADLARAGWAVTGPTATADGGVDFTAAKPFANPARAKSVVRELSGPTGPFRDLTVTRHSSFFRTTTGFGGTLDLTCGVDCFTDPQLQQALGGAGAGIDPSALQADAGIAVNQAFQFAVAVRLPGTMHATNAPSQVGNDAVWTADLGQKAVLAASARAWNGAHIVAAAVAAVAALLALVWALVKLRRVARRSRAG